MFKTVSDSGAIVSRSAYFYEENISMATAAPNAQVSKFCFHRDISGIKLSHLLCMYVCTYACICIYEYR
jgi:hypothetical protein